MEHIIASKTGLSEKSIASILSLRSDGGTVPFIARYRKERTGGLDEVAIQRVFDAEKSINELQKRKDAILKKLAETEGVPPKTYEGIKNSWDLRQIEDYYLPYKPKKRTKAEIARNAGLEPLAKILMSQNAGDVKTLAKRYVSDSINVEQALEGARHIISEWIAERSGARNRIRRLYEKTALLEAKVIAKKKAEAENYRDYFDFNQRLSKVPSHRFLAVQRAQNEGFLKVKLCVDQKEAASLLSPLFIKETNASASQVELAITDALKRLIFPSIENEILKEKKEEADKIAIQIFCKNLKQLLLAPPVGGKSTLAIDPGFRTGCKVACLDAQGNFICSTTIFPHAPQQQFLEAAEKLSELIKMHNIKAIAIGNGTAGRETEQLVKGLPLDQEVSSFVVNESGASIYSASELARAEFPKLDITVRGAISIGRRLMDPLAELVKIDPKSIGVGQYQHDVNQEALKSALDATVESAVNQVGVNVNTASEYLLKYVAGIGPKLANTIVLHRAQNGAFKNREALKKVKGLGAKSFEQSAGFLRIRQGNNPLDNSGIHPERYALVNRILKDLKTNITELLGNQNMVQQIKIESYLSEEVGKPTLTDLMKELAKPGVDPRGSAKQFSFEERVKEINDIREGMWLPGKVTNLTNFGAFVDIGIKENGLLHLSQIANRFIKDPAEELHLGQELQVKVLGVDLVRKRIQLSLKE